MQCGGSSLGREASLWQRWLWGMTSGGEMRIQVNIFSSIVHPFLFQICRTIFRSWREDQIIEHKMSCAVAGVSSFVGHSGDVYVWLGEGSFADAGAEERNSLFFFNNHEIYRRIIGCIVLPYIFHEPYRRGFRPFLCLIRSRYVKKWTGQVSLSATQAEAPYLLSMTRIIKLWHLALHWVFKF